MRQTTCPRHRPARAKALRRTALFAGLLGLAACNATMMASAPAVNMEAITSPIVVTAIGGISPAGAHRLAAVFNQAAAARGFTVSAFADAPGATRLTLMLDTAPTEGGTNALTWVMQVSPDGRTRTARLGGIEAVGAGNTDAALDDAIARKIAIRALDHLALVMSGTKPEPSTDLAAIAGG